MNILFALFNDFGSNSAVHVHAIANGLASLGHNCVVAVPQNRDSVSQLPKALYGAVEFSDVLQGGLVFPDGRGPDILHAWTPREVVRTFCTLLKDRIDCRLFIHMEDNEYHLLTCALGTEWDRLNSVRRTELEERYPGHLSHPERSAAFLASADGVTVIIDKLKELVPGGVPTLELWPSAEETFLRPWRRSDLMRRRLGVAKNSAVVVYTGNVHEANSHEVRSLYLATAILNREGFPITLVRTGRDYSSFLGPDETWARQHSIELGYVARTELPMLLAQADILVQPGVASRFNDFRFPSKLPEFLSAGKPVIVPAANIAAYMEHKRHAYILPEANAVEIASAIREISGDPVLKARLSMGALEFFREHLSWTRSVEKLSAFYESCPSKAFGAARLGPLLKWSQAACAAGSI